MKTTTIILMAIGFISLTNCEPKTATNAMLENTETRTELFNAIASNNDYMIEFIGNIQGDDHAMQMMRGNQNAMGAMMKNEDMNIINDSMMSMQKDAINDERRKNDESYDANDACRRYDD